MRHIIKALSPRVAVSAASTSSRALRALFTLCLCLSVGSAADAFAAGVCTTPVFAPPTVYNARAVRSVAVADFDVDGKLDLVALNHAESGSLSLYLGDGTGAFPFRSTLFQKGRRPNSVAAGDFNGDGRPDVVVANGTSVDGNAIVYLNDNLMFQQEVRLDWTSPGIRTNSSSVAVADFNADGKLDVVLTNIDFNAVFVALGDGAGNFSNFKNYSTNGFYPVHVVARDFNGDGKVDLAVANQAATGNNVSILLGNGIGGFGVATTHAAGGSPSFIETGDFNSDNKIDLAVASYGSGQNISILLGNGAGAFGAPTTFSSGGTSPGTLAAADFNGDGKIDLAAVNQHEANVVILSGNGAGSFSPSASYESGASSPNFVTAADLNSDGNSDLVIGHELPQKVSVLVNTCGAGDQPPTLGFSAPSYATNEANGIFNVTVNRSGALAGAATVNYATSDGTATNPSDYKATSGTLSFAPGEASKTFPVEVVNDALDETNETVFVTLGNPSGSAVLGTASAATIHIFDDDLPPSVSVSDASVAEGNGGTTSAVFTIRLSGASGLQVQVNYATSDVSTSPGLDYVGVSGTLTFAPGETSKTIAVTVNGDTTPEVNDNFLLTLTAPANAFIADPQGVGTIIDDDSACPTPSFNSRVDHAVGFFPHGIVTGDFNKDGKPDVALAHLESYGVSLLLGNGSGGFAAPRNFPANAGRSLAAGDVNVDGNLDLVTSGGLALLGDGTGNFTTVANSHPGQFTYVLVVDLNLDGKPDLAGVNFNQVSIMRGDGAGGFGAPVIYAAGTSPRHLVTGDFNGDGKIDLVVANMNSQNVSLMLGDGAGAFEAARNFEAGANPAEIGVGDFNRDGKADLAVTDEGSNSVSILFGNGAAGFSAPSVNGVGVRPTGLVVADFNGDQQADLAVTNFVSQLEMGSLSVLFGNGAGNFTLPTTYEARLSPTDLVTGDFNGDAKPDLVFVNLYSHSVSLMTNACSGTPSATVQFAAGSYAAGEGDGHAAVTVTRTGDTSAAVSVDYRTVDADTFTVSCADVSNTGGAAFARCDFAGLVGTLSFAPGESQKTILVPVVNDAHDEAAETFRLVLSDAAGAVLGTTSEAVVTIGDDDAAGAPNPVFSTPFFVRQHYLDFLSREPEQGEPWSAVLNNCSNVNDNPLCDRITVSQSFFGSPEFRLKGFYVFRFYRVAFGRLPEYAEMVADMSFVAGATAEEVYARRAQLAQRFAGRTEFRGVYDGMTDAAFVDALLARYQLAQVTTPDPARPDEAAKVTLTRADLAGGLASGALTRAQVLRAVADSDEVGVREYAGAFVAMQYYGYLRRKPDAEGYEAWLRVIERGGDARAMVGGFLNSAEYRLRFGGL